MELYLIRHGQSTNNALPDPRNRICDPPLTELGCRQAQRVAQYLASALDSVGHSEPLSGRQPDGRVTRLFASPMWRALQTAQPIGRALGLQPEVWLQVHEHGGIYLDHGETGGIVGYPGKRRSEVLVEFPDYILPDGLAEDGWWRSGREERAGCNRRA